MARFKLIHKGLKLLPVELDVAIPHPLGRIFLADLAIPQQIQYRTAFHFLLTHEFVHLSYFRRRF